MNKTLDHLHTYERVKLDGNEVYRCTHPDCTFLTQRVLILGKRARCACGEAFILTNELLRRKRPHCEKCFKTERGAKAKKAAQISQEFEDESLSEVLRNISLKQ